MSTEKRSGTVLFLGKRAGRLTESEEGYVFRYEAKFLEDPGALPISVTLPLRKEPFLSRELHPFFDGLLPEGWTLEHVARNRNLDPEDRMDLLLACCRECVGAVSIGEDNSEEDSLGGIGADEVPPAAASHPDAAVPMETTAASAAVNPWRQASLIPPVRAGSSGRTGRLSWT